MAEQSAWGRDLETGLRDDYDATIVNSYFGTDARYAADDGALPTLLKWEIRGEDDEGIAFEDTLLITVGKGWESIDDGKTVRHSSGKDKFFNANSHLGKIIARIGDLGNLGEVLEERGTPFEAGVWNGLRFHFKREEMKYGGGEVQKSSKTMPTEFHGVDDGKGGGGAAKASAPAAEKASPAAPAAASNGADPEEKKIRVKLAMAAKKAGTHEEFVDAAMEVDGAMTNEAIWAEVMDESGIYAEANG